MIIEPVERVVGELTDAFNAHDIERVLGFYSSDYTGVDVGRADPQIGHEGLRQAFGEYLHAFPDLRVEEKETIMDSERIVQVWVASGTHRGTVMNIPPTGRHISVRGVSVLTLRQGQVQRGLYLWDVAGLLRSIGLLPEL